MERILRKIFLEHATRKVFALFAAVIIWYIADHSITTTRVFTRVPIRIVNLPPEMTVRGLMPNGILDRKLTLTITGIKDTLNQLEPGDFEVVIDASDKGMEWVVQIGKKNLVSLNPDINLIHNITSVSHHEFVIKLSRLITERIPIYISPPKGEPPEGYQFLDVWPQKLTHVVSGPEEDVKELQSKGIELSFHLNEISKEDLDSLKSENALQTDEVSYLVPESWKKVAIPFLNNIKQEINGPEARYLRIDFLRKEMFPLEKELPMYVFYPLAQNKVINPLTCPLIPNGWIVNRNGNFIVNKPLFVKNVSRLFLDVVRERIEIVLIASKPLQNESLKWAIQFIDSQALEDAYIASILSEGKEGDSSTTAGQKAHRAQRERYFRARFQEYMQEFQLFLSKDLPLNVNAHIEGQGIIVDE